MARSSLFPGFRFHPTDVELVMFYLKRKLLGKKITVKAVAEVNIYDFSPWDLPDKSALKSGDLEWYFFCPNEKKYSSGCRSTRSTETGFWKATGKERQVNYNGRTVATIKTLVFHLGYSGKGQRTDWVMHEYKMKDAHLANAGIVQDMYVLCKVFEKSGSGPKNGACYGAPFNEEEWGDDLASSIDSNVAGLFGASDTMDNPQKDLVTMNMTEQDSSIVTVSSNQLSNILNDKKKGPAVINMTEPGSSPIVTFSADQPTNTVNEEECGYDVAGCINSEIVDGATNMMDNKQKGQATMNTAEPAATNMTEPGSSIVTFSADQPTKTLNDKQKGPAATIMAGPQTTHGDVLCIEDIDLPADDAVLSFDDDDVIFIEDVNVIMRRKQETEATNVERVKSMMPIKDDGAFDGLVNLIDLDDLNEIDFKADIDADTLDKILSLDDLDEHLGEFYVD
ncbi:hypothetical protein E3N88_24998 [Mikania micrantha]|uniref:NAC domain-containing protein n=1 Tax=Mikania micrantha TaxID=192012 RepID=A0A5N6N559_9ASTR|nr:hypothetical protein E3N88_24998 [Mikania micrantha]